MPNPSQKPRRTAKILWPTLENLALAARALQHGELVGMPTETVYGLAGDCKNPKAVARIFEAKQRPTFDPLIVHVSTDHRCLEDLARSRLVDLSPITPIVRQQVDRLIQHFWPGPLTLILPKHPDIPDLVTSGLPSVALRMPSHPVAQALIATSRSSLAAPSANRFGKISPTTSQAVLEELGDRIPWILEGGSSQIGVESTVIGWSTGGNIVILRQGGTPQEAIQTLLAEVRVECPPPLSSQAPLLASPGMLASHYAPTKPFYLLPQTLPDLLLTQPNTAQRFFSSLPSPTRPNSTPWGLILMSGEEDESAVRFSQLTGRPTLAKTLSKTGDLEEAAKNLFSSMRSLDASPAETIFCEPCTQTQGLGHAIRDRIKRASSKSR